jgi:hypothetical protein
MTGLDRIATLDVVLRDQEDRDLFALRRQERAAEATLEDLERRLAELGERLELTPPRQRDRARRAALQPSSRFLPRDDVSFVVKEEHNCR